MKILVVDDEATSRLIARVTLRELGHQCHVVDEGGLAWDAFLALKPDVVISDWVMPGLTGLELCRKIRAETAVGYPYFIMVTSQGAGEQVVEGMMAGADDFLIKPLLSADLKARLIAAERVTSLHQQLEVRRGELEHLNHELTAISLRDPLTGLGNRRALDDDLDPIRARVDRYGQRYCIGLVDVDDFKAYNDTYGHQAGDQALRAVAAQLKDQARRGDALYRYGGEEFLCIFPEQSLVTAGVAIERMRSGLQAMAIPHSGSATGVLTISAGLAIFEPDQARSVDAVLKDADEALYRAKRLGRNQVEHTLPPAELGKSK
jgi:two-component system chemotaxis response regulator CheY